jgi:hypothetical protein
MTYKILYIEDGDPGSIISDLESHDFSVEYHEPKDFEESITKAASDDIDLLLLDFRLSDSKAIYDAPTLAQTIRTKDTDHYRNTPIVLISSEDNISGYYKDYTSQDLFDFAISKKVFSENLPKYTVRMNSLINGYNSLVEIMESKRDLSELLKIPEAIDSEISPRIRDLLYSGRYKNNSFMASTFIVNHLVKPSGLLIGEEILAARLGVDIKSSGWVEFRESLNELKYEGIYSDSYARWWSAGLELWWEANFKDNPSIKRLKAKHRVELIKKALGIVDLEPAQKLLHAKSDYFWTICSSTKAPLDPIDGFEKDKWAEPWEDPEYFSLVGVSRQSSIKFLKIIDRKRYSKEAEKI